MLKHKLGGWVLMAPNEPDGGSPNPSGVEEPVSPTDPNEPQEPVEPSEPGEPTEPVEPSDDPVEPTEPQEPVEPQEPQTPVVVDKEEDKALPFHKHPRFQEVIAEKNTFKTELDKAKPLLDQVNAQNEILRTHNIAPQEFQSAIQYLIALRTNPQAAFEMLKPTFEQLSMFVGERLPDDLAAKVAAGTLDPQDAKALAKARGQETYQNARQNWQQNGQQQQVGDVVSQSTSLWLGTKQTIDPDLKEGTPLWEQTNLRLLAMAPARSAQERMQQCETAYKAAKTFLGGLQPKPVVKTQKAPLQSRQQSNGSKFVIKTEADAMKAIKLGLKPHQVSYV